jgi:antitoxin component of MazEF toxin-antitoxin module
MTQLPIVPHGGSAAVVIPPDVLEAAGLRIGDTVNVTLRDRQLILQPSEDASRRQQIEEITGEVLEHRRDAYRRLA